MNFGPGTPVPSHPFNSAQPRRQQQRDLNNQHSLFPYTTITAIEIPQTDRQIDRQQLIPVLPVSYMATRYISLLS